MSSTINQNIIYMPDRTSLGRFAGNGAETVNEREISFVGDLALVLAAGSSSRFVSNLRGIPRFLNNGGKMT
jgi:hypothetical protein